jgi:Protein of unknown function (DUF2961)
MNLENPAFIDSSIDSRAVTFENPTGARGAGGSAHGGRKGAPNMWVRAGESVLLADIDGPGTIRHLWMTIPPAPPEVMRSLVVEVFYDGMTEPSVSVPFVDFFGLPHGRPVEYHSVLHAVQEGRGFNSYVPMPFGEHVRIVATNGGERSIILYYQVDFTLGPLDDGAGYLHVGFRRENPTVQKRDFVIVDGLEGPGRFLGCAIGVRVIDAGDWYGEGEVKVFRDGDDELPTICGTGLEDYVGSAWGMGAHAAPYGGAPVNVGPAGPDQPEFVSFYRWHVLDPIMFTSDLKVTIQQIGAKFFPLGGEAMLAEYEKTHPVAGEGWQYDAKRRYLAWGIAERVDDYCAVSYVYCTRPQAVPRLEIAVALADIERRPWETAHPSEAISAVVGTP